VSEWLPCFFAVAFLAATLLTPLLREIAVRLGVVAVPDPLIKSHVRATPLLGGAAIVAPLVPVLVVCGFRDPYWVTVAGAVVAMAALGGYKDWVRREVSPLWQIAMQVGVVAVLQFSAKPVLMSGHGVVAGGLSMLCCVWIINGWNFLDVMDGLASGVAAIVAIFFAAGHAHIGGVESAILSTTLAGGLAGFWMHNYPPAKIFMGDLGSFSIGILFCGLLLNGLAHSSADTIIGFGLMLMVPLFDVAATSLTRILACRSPLIGHSPDHLCLHLSHCGWSDRMVISCAYLLALLTGLIGLSWIFHR